MEDITTQELRQRIEAGEKLNVLDVREPWEFEEDNLNGLLIPLGELPTRFGEIEAWKEQEVIVHCRTGGRSGKAKDFLKTKGFTKVRNLLGGITEYRENEEV
ncbi:MAG: rhodanese-like domain-containing protein [Raineya sp.]